MNKKYTIPDRANLHNYMLDTTAYNHISMNSEMFKIIKESRITGFCYYTTKIQDMELLGYGAKTYGQDGMPNIKYHMPSEQLKQFDEIEEQLNVGLVPEVGLLMFNHFRADGTHRFIDIESIEGQIFNEIVSKNNSQSKRPFAYSHDAVIAEAAIHYGCILVTDDKELRETINSYMSVRAISTDELVEIIKEYQAK